MDLFSNNTQVDARAVGYCARIPNLVGDWWKVLKDFNFEPIIEGLVQMGDMGKKIYPSSANMFRCFKECPLDKLKVVFVGQDPYYQPNVADGLAFSCSKTLKLQPSLKLIYDEIDRTVYFPTPVERDPDLKYLAEQGVVLLNSALSVEAYKPDSHTDLWAPFIQYLIPAILRHFPDTIFVFVGGRAKGFMSLCKGRKMGVIHPAAAAHRGGRWDCEDIFNRINQELKSLGKDQITW